MREPLIEVNRQDGFRQFVFPSDLNLFVDGDGIVRISSPICNVKEILLTPSECRDALFEERDLWL